MAEYITTTTELQSVADAIREKGKTSDPLIFPDEFNAAIKNITTAPKDPHTLLLIHGNNIRDVGKYDVPLTNNGVKVSTAQSKFGTKSLYFDGNSWINFPQKYAAYLDKDFTIDWWEYCTTSDENHQSRYFSTDAGGSYKTLGLLLGHLGTQAYCGDGWSMISGAEMFNITQNAWVHWAAVRHGDTLLTFRNGVKFAQAPIKGSIPYDEKTMHCIGGWRYSPGQKWIGYMSEFRISDVARWTDNFVPPTAPYTNEATAEIKPLTVTDNGTYNAPQGVDGYNPVTVNVPKGIDTSDANVTPQTMLRGVTGYAKGKKVTGSIPSIPEQTITPSNKAQTIAAGGYLQGAQTIQGDANLIAENIKAGASIFGVLGNFEGGGKYEVLTGKFTVPSDVASYDVPGTEGMATQDKPDVYFMCRDITTNVATKGYMSVWFSLANKDKERWYTSFGGYGITSSGSPAYSSYSGGYMPKTSAEKIQLKGSRGGIKLKGGTTYEWVYVRPKK